MTNSEPRRIDSMDDIIDSRDVIARIDWLETQIQDNEDQDEDQRDEWADELISLCELRDAAQPYTEDWDHGSTIIADSYAEDYAREWAEDIIHGAALRESGWPFDHIDWEAATQSFLQDYTEFEWDGFTFWVR